MIPFYQPYQMASYHKYVSNQVSSGQIGPGKRVEEFEELLAEKVGAKYAVATNSGTSAIMASIWAMGVEGELCWFPAYGYPAGANAAKILGCSVYPIDVDDRGVIVPRKPAVGFRIAVRHNGACPDNCNFIRTIDDSSVSIGIPGTAIGPVRTYSFSVPKLVTTGQGGAVATNDLGLADAVRHFIDQGGDWRQTRRHSRIGLNLRMADINAALGIPQLHRLEELVERRKQVRRWYGKHILVDDMDDAWCVTYLSENAVRLRSYLAENGIQSEMLYRPMNENPAYECRGRHFPMAQKLADETLYLPSSLSLTEGDVNRVCESILEFNEAAPGVR